MISQKVLFPGWNNLSTKQKSLVKEWIDSLIRLKAASEELSESLSNTNEEQKLSPIDNWLTNFQFEVVDSSTTSEGIRIEEIIPSLLLGSRENPCEALCYAICALNSNPNCVKDCKKKLCN